MLKGTAIVKRIFDLSSAVFGLIILSPIFLVAALAIKLDSPGPVFFRQKRIGQHGIPFRIFKFRTMTVTQNSDAPEITAANDERVTGIGSFLRQHKIDELPQLLNVLFGNMSIVGPRPELAKFVALYPPEVRDVVLSVRPGITDYAAIEFRDESSLLENTDNTEQAYVDQIMPRKLELYVDYVGNQSLLLDIRLIFRTLCNL